MIDGLHLLPRHRAKIEELLHEHLPDVEVWAYGSRVTGESHDGSDLDLVLRGPELKEIALGSLGDFTEAVQLSTIPFIVEARDWARIPKSFHKSILQRYVVLQAETEPS
jgi:predicted nucleotidyltransferase